MKMTFTAAAFTATILATSVQAGGLAEPVFEIEPEQVEAATQASSSSAGLIIPLVLIALLAAALSSSSGGATELTDLQ